MTSLRNVLLATLIAIVAATMTLAGASAADVILKERRKLVLMVREAPLNDIHLENMLKLSRMGVVITPPSPAFYTNPQSLDDMINHIVMRALDAFGIHVDVSERWTGLSPLPSGEGRAP